MINRDLRALLDLLRALLAADAECVALEALLRTGTVQPNPGGGRDRLRMADDAASFTRDLKAVFTIACHGTPPGAARLQHVYDQATALRAEWVANRMVREPCRPALLREREMSGRVPAWAAEVDAAFDHALQAVREAIIAAIPGELPSPRSGASAVRDIEPDFPEEGLDLEATLDRIEQQYLRLALARAGDVQTKAAELLRMTFRQFRYKLQKHGRQAERLD